MENYHLMFLWKMLTETLYSFNFKTLPPFSILFTSYSTILEVKTEEKTLFRLYSHTYVNICY